MQCSAAVEICAFARAEIFAVQTHMNPLTVFLEGGPNVTRIRHDSL